MVGLVASEFRLKADTFLSLDNHPCFFLFANSEFLFAPGLILEAAAFLSQIATVCPDMGVELCWSCYDLMAGSGGGGCRLSIVLVQKYGTSAGKGQNVSRSDVLELAVHTGSCKNKGGGGLSSSTRQSQLRLVAMLAGKFFE